MSSRSGLKSVMRLLDSASKEIPVEIDFLNNLKRSIELTENKKDHTVSKTYKPSSMNCIRNMWYQIVGQEVKEVQSNYSLVGILQSGSDIHEHIQTAVLGMKENGMNCEYVDVEEYIKSRGLDYLEIRGKNGIETKVYHKDLNMSFMTDGIIRYNGKYYLLEIKTETSYKFGNRRGVDPKHFNQGTAYSIAFGIDEIIYLYISRDVLDMKAYLFIPSQEMKDNLIEKIKKCNAYVTKNEVPPKPEEACDRFCMYCNYKHICDSM